METPGSTTAHHGIGGPPPNPLPSVVQVRRPPVASARLSVLPPTDRPIASDETRCAKKSWPAGACNASGRAAPLPSSNARPRTAPAVSRFHPVYEWTTGATFAGRSIQDDEEDNEVDNIPLPHLVTISHSHATEIDSCAHKTIGLRPNLQVVGRDSGQLARSVRKDTALALPECLQEYRIRRKELQPHTSHPVGWQAPPQ
jgi:hypothetical protein